MQVHVSDDPALDAAQQAIASLSRILNNQKAARILAATGNSQLRFLHLLTAESAIDWQRVELFHLDEYIGISSQHKASFSGYIRDKVITPTGIKSYHLLDGLAEPAKVVSQVGSLLSAAPIDLAFAGIGENGHLAFNDPPADFEIQDPYIVVALDEACRYQQVGEGWFASLAEVPRQAISISVHQLMKSKEIICVVPDLRKARAVAACLDGDVSPDAPASVLRIHPNARIYLDRDSASLLRSAMPIN